jgi:hypothetical protein
VNYLKKIFSIVRLLPLLLIASCEKSQNQTVFPVMLLKTSEPVSISFIGNGAQWGGYDLLKDWTGKDDFSDQDWQKLADRIAYMRPPFVRIMIDAGWNYIKNGAYDPSKTSAAFLRILEYCNANGIVVMFGEWGHHYLNNNIQLVDKAWMEWSASYLDWLINVKGFSCIKYYNMVNEPNGDWSSTNQDYELWKTIMIDYHAKLVSKGLDTRVSLVGPDAAVWDAGLISWVTNITRDMGDKVGLYDLHTYPEQSFVRSGDYLDMLMEYKSVVPPGKQIVVGEIGFKYYQNDYTLQTENTDRIKADPFASSDCNMFVYDAFYGIDMSDAIIQCMMAGYSGALVWSMDDAMYNKSENSEAYNVKKLKRWGFWNILGSEVCGDAADEEIRPFFYPVSLLCRYFPAGAQIFQFELPAKKGLHAIAAEKDGFYTIAIVNSNYVSYKNIYLKAENNIKLEGLKKFRYLSGIGSAYTARKDGKGFPLPEEENLTLDMGKGFLIDVEAQSVVIFTNFQF